VPANHAFESGIDGGNAPTASVISIRAEADGAASANANIRKLAATAAAVAAPFERRPPVEGIADASLMLVVPPNGDRRFALR
jgi:hypothetical protein